MFPTVSYDQYANRFAPHSDYFTVRGYDWTGASTAMEIRDRKNGGAVQATIVPVITVTDDDGTPISKVTWSITKSVNENMSLDPAEPDADVTFFYDVHVTPSGVDEFVPVRGRYILQAGVTQ